MQAHRNVVPCIFTSFMAQASEELRQTTVMFAHALWRKDSMKRSTSYVQCLRSRGWRFILALVAVAGIIITTDAFGVSSPPALAASLPCDIYAAAGTPCVAAHSTTRALLSSYSGKLYQI